MVAPKENRAIVLAIAETMHEFPDIYATGIAPNVFRGGWTEEPKYTVSDYQEYSSWLKGNGPMPEDIRKTVLIGANKIFGILEDFKTAAERYLMVKVPDRALQRAIDLRLSDDLSLRVDSPKDMDHYSYKELYVEDPKGEIIHTRAASTYEFNGFESLSGGSSKSVEATKKRMDYILGVFKKLHREVGRRMVRFNLDLPLDLEVCYKKGF